MMKWLWMVLLAGCAAPMVVPPGSPLGPSEMNTCHRLGQYLVCNPTVELASE